MVELLGQLVDTASHASQHAGVARVAQLIGEQLAPVGLQLREHPARAVAVELAWLERIMSPETPYDQLAASYVARREASQPGAPRMLLLGDLDTAAPAAGEADQPFAIRDDGRAYGAGVADMKGGLVVMVTALRALAAVGAPTPSLSLVLAGDEQAGSLSSRALIEAEGRGADWCLCFECARDGGRVMHARAHIGVGRLEATGQEAHAGSAHSRGRNAIDALARAIPSLNQLTRPTEGVYVTVTIVSGGRRRSVVPAHASAVLDIRTPNASGWARVRSDIERVVREASKSGAQVSVSIHDHRPGFGLRPEGQELLEVVRRCGRELGLVVESQASPAAGSSAFVGAMGVPTIDGMGPSGGDLMTPGEYVELESLAPRAALAALTIASHAGSNKKSA
jgi:glutamate carboxypeptidase